MLTSLSIRDFVSIRRLDIEPGHGFTALTGETGAGKSILIEALGVALGSSADRRFVRAGAEQAVVAAEFSLPVSHPAFGMMEEAGLITDRAEPVQVRRAVRESGPSRAFINDQPVSASLLSAIGETMVEVHGQHANTGLLRPASHRHLLDLFAGNGALIEEVRAAWTQLEQSRMAHEEARRFAAAGADERSFLAESLAELDRVGPVPGEVSELTAERQSLTAIRRIGESLEEARLLVSDGIEDRITASSRALTRAQRALGDEAVAIGARLDSFADGLERALIEAQQVAGGLDALLSSLGGDEGRLEEIESRLFALKAAARKHGVNVNDLAQTREVMSARLEQIEDGAGALARAAAAEQTARAGYAQAAAKLSDARGRAGERLAQAVMAELAPLKLERARFRVAMTETDPAPSGQDDVVFEIATSPGAAFGPLRQIASGGELARFSLALKLALSETGDAGTMIFDEVDQGVGGAVAVAIGERLGRLAAHRQLLVVTHSPQVASCARRQLRIEKEFGNDGLGITRLAVLSDTERRDEIARMLSGREVTPEARAAAGRLLEREADINTAGSDG